MDKEDLESAKSEVMKSGLQMKKSASKMPEEYQE
jgi:hypothetical protein